MPGLPGGGSFPEVRAVWCTQHSPPRCQCGPENPKGNPGRSERGVQERGVWTVAAGFPMQSMGIYNWRKFYTFKYFIETRAFVQLHTREGISVRAEVKLPQKLFNLFEEKDIIQFFLA